MSRPDEGFETFDHTGDLGLTVWAPSRERLFELAAEALLAQVARPRAAEDSGAGHARAAPLKTPLALEGDDPEDLLVHWLNSVLLESALRHALWMRVRVERLSDTGITAMLEGERLDPARHEFLREIKAVSHHHLALDLTPGACRCRLILDI